MVQSADINRSSDTGKKMLIRVCGDTQLIYRDCMVGLTHGREQPRPQSQIVVTKPGPSDSWTGTETMPFVVTMVTICLNWLLHLVLLNAPYKRLSKGMALYRVMHIYSHVVVFVRTRHWLPSIFHSLYNLTPRFGPRKNGKTSAHIHTRTHTPDWQLSITPPQEKPWYRHTQVHWRLILVTGWSIGASRPETLQARRKKGVL